MSILEIYPLTNGHPTNSFDIQNALSQVGEGKQYDSLHFNAGTYNIDDSIKIKNPYSVLAFNSGSKIFGDVDKNGNYLVKFQLMRDAPVRIFACSVPIFGPSEELSHNIEFYNFWYDGNCPIGGGFQAPMKAATCAGSHVGTGQETGKTFHNMFATPHCGILNFEMHHFKATNTAGDIFRTHQWNQCSSIKIHDGEIIDCGHCGLMLENSIGTIDAPIEIRNCKITTRGNGAVRLQNYCKNVLIDNIHVIGTQYDYNPGMQLTGENVTISNCLIENTMGAGIEFQGSDNTNLLVNNNRFKNCGIYTAEYKFAGVGGLLLNGVSGTIENNWFEDCKGFGVVVGVYSPDGTIFKSKGYKISVQDNIFRNTTPANYTGGKPSGYHIANLMPDTHEIKAYRNTFDPDINSYYNVTVEKPVSQPVNLLISCLESQVPDITKSIKQKYKIFRRS